MISKKKRFSGLHMLTSQCHFDGPPLELMGPLLGPLKPMVPLKSMGPEVIVLSQPPPLGGPANARTKHSAAISSRWGLTTRRVNCLAPMGNMHQVPFPRPQRPLAKLRIDLGTSNLSTTKAMFYHWAMAAACYNWDHDVSTWRWQRPHTFNLK